MTDIIYDPIEFVGKIELITIAIVGSFITMKLLNSLYENIYEPTIDSLVDSPKTDNYYIKIGSYYVQVASIVKEFIKWFLLILILMIIYNFVVRPNISKKN